MRRALDLRMPSVWILTAASLVAPSWIYAEEQEPIEVSVYAKRVANEDPALTYAAPVSTLRFEPLVDLQERNSGEAQGDLAIRGGTFETSGLRLGAATILDPQTGHYLTEIPLDPFMLGTVQRVTGLDNAELGFNNGSGSVVWGFAPITETTASARLGFGDFATNVQSAYIASPIGEDGVGCDVGAAHSESNGTREDGDQDFSRVSGRCQILTDSSQTDLIAGYNDKSFSWRYLYALRELHDLVGSSGVESESLHTTLVMVNHRMFYGSGEAGSTDLRAPRLVANTEESGGFFEFAPVFRRNRDNYEFDVAQPGLFNPYEHTTETSGLNMRGEHREGSAGLRYSAQSLYEDVDSTALTSGEYLSRSRWRGTLVPTYAVDLDGENAEVVFALGVAYGDSNRSDGRLSPLSEISLINARADNDWEALTASVTQMTELPGFTAIGSSPSAGLFRGNQDLAQTLSTTYELSAEVERPSFGAEAAVFYRRDDNLVDWTYKEGVQPFAARTANSVDVGVTGTELSAHHAGDWHALYLGYFFLHQTSRYDVDADVDASFYAMNFPKHRVTSAVVLSPTDLIDLRFDVEWREQEPNSLRTSSDNTYSLGALSATLKIPGFEQLGLSFVVDNLWNENFEEVPGVPGVGRAAGVFLTGRI